MVGPSCNVSSVIGGINDVFKMAIEEASILGNIEKFSDVVSSWENGFVGTQAESGVEVPLQHDDFLVGWADEVSEVVFPDPSVGIIGSGEGCHRKGAHPLIDVDDGVEGVFEICSTEVPDGLVDGDDLRVIIASPGTADLESKAVKM